MMPGRISLPMALSANDQFFWLSLIKTGSKQTYIAKKYGTSQPNIYNWPKKNRLQDIKPEYQIIVIRVRNRAV